MELSNALVVTAVKASFERTLGGPSPFHSGFAKVRVSVAGVALLEGLVAPPWKDFTAWTISVSSLMRAMRSLRLGCPANFCCTISGSLRTRPSSKLLRTTFAYIYIYQNYRRISTLIDRRTDNLETNACKELDFPFHDCQALQGGELPVKGARGTGLGAGLVRLVPEARERFSSQCITGCWKILCIIIMIDTQESNIKAGVLIQQKGLLNLPARQRPFCEPPKICQTPMDTNLARSFKGLAGLEGSKSTTNRFCGSLATPLMSCFMIFTVAPTPLCCT